MADRPPCPGCGQPLAPVDLGPESPPWVCATCRRGWWDAELTAEARKAWQPALQAFEWPIGRDIVGPAVDAEMRAAGEKTKAAS